MSSPLLLFLALCAGAALAAQATANARLGVILGNSVVATAYAFFASLVVTLVAVLVIRRPLPDMEIVQRVPLLYWLIGGVLSCFGVGAFYWLIPKLGAGSVVAFGLVGQLIFAAIASHRGWFHLPVQTLGRANIVGITFLLVGAVLMQRR